MTTAITRKVFTGGAWIKKGEEGRQLLSARVSTADRDRDGEVIEPGGIDYSRYLTNPILAWAHDMTRPTIGKAVAISADARGLNCKFEFAGTPFGTEIFDLYRGGYLSAWSIGFLPVEFDPRTKTHKRIELLEISAVPVGANPQALVTAIGKGLHVSKALQKDLGLEEFDLAAIKAEPEIDPAMIEPAIDAALARVKAAVQNSVALAIDKARGRVR